MRKAVLIEVTGMRGGPTECGEARIRDVIDSLEEIAAAYGDDCMVFARRSFGISSDGRGCYAGVRCMTVACYDAQGVYSEFTDRFEEEVGRA